MEQKTIRAGGRLRLLKHKVAVTFTADEWTKVQIFRLCITHTGAYATFVFAPVLEMN